MMAGFPIGLANALLWISLLNYLTDAYEIFAASALASSQISRSLAAALLPMATEPMYSALGVKWATSLLGFITLAMACIPFVFIKYGSYLRERSPFCQLLLQQKRSSHGNDEPVSSARGQRHVSHSQLTMAFYKH